MSTLRVLEKARSKPLIPGNMATAFIGLVVELARAYREWGGAAAGIAAEVATAVLSAAYERPSQIVNTMDNHRLAPKGVILVHNALRSSSM